MKTIPIIQNVDRIIRPRDYDHLDDKLLVTSFFKTIQGEGPYAVHPAIFLRLAGCNFGDKHDHCAFCDTSFQFDQGKAYDFSELTYELTNIPGYSKSDILVITGGEPTLQLNLLYFIHGMDELFKRVQIETNGTQLSFFKEIESHEMAIDFDENVLSYVRPSIVVSPKASQKAGRYAESSELVKQLASCFKFVVTADETDVHHEVPKWALDLSASGRTPVYVSPMAVYKKPYQGEVASAWDRELIDAEATSRNYAYAAEYALKHNLRLSIQQHLFLGVA